MLEKIRNNHTKDHKGHYSYHNVLIALLLSIICFFALLFPNNAAAQIQKVSADKDLTVYFLDVGQGDATFLQCSGQTMLIDGGKAEESSFIYAWLKKHNISYIDYMVATHPDADHIGGLSGALNYAKIGKAYCSTTTASTKTFKNLVKYLDKQGEKLTVPKTGKTFSLGEAEVQIIGPVNKTDDTNNSSLVLKVTYGNNSFLFTGDAEREEENDLLDSDFDISSTVLKVGHHGSDSSTSYRFLREVDPEYAVISVGEDNSYR